MRQQNPNAEEAGETRPETSQPLLQSEDQSVSCGVRVRKTVSLNSENRKENGETMDSPQNLEYSFLERRQSVEKGVRGSE